MSREYRRYTRHVSAELFTKLAGSYGEIAHSARNMRAHKVYYKFIMGS